MSTTPQKRALNRYRKRLSQRGMARFEVLGLDADRELIRSLAKRLADSGPDSARIRDTVRLTISGNSRKGRYFRCTTPVASGRRRSGFEPPPDSGPQG